MIYRMGKPVRRKIMEFAEKRPAEKTVNDQTIALKKEPKQHKTATVKRSFTSRVFNRSITLSDAERIIAIKFGKLPFSWEDRWDAKLEPPC